MTTTDKFWDCECDYNYVKSYALKKCHRCGASQISRPKSSFDECVELGLLRTEEEMMILNFK
jgi:hypothetical protein